MARRVPVPETEVEADEARLRALRFGLRPILQPACDPPVEWPQPEGVPIRDLLAAGGSPEEVEALADELGLLERLRSGARSCERRNP